MPTYKIRGIDVDFPYQAYDCQLVYMEKVIESLQNKCNALLESPTGTGKTLCLLCATLAWRKSLGEFTRVRKERIRVRASQCSDDTLSPSSRDFHDKNGTRANQISDDEMPLSQSSKYPVIIYASRTHSQIRQVVQELKRSNYRPNMVVLGSREQLCIHDQVSLLRGKAQTNACHALCKKRTKRYCSHFSLVTEFLKKNPGIGHDPIDIEDLVNIGRSCGPCPYYLSRELHKDVDILFAPYNYLIDRGNRKSLKIDWNKSILIFDEAHNLESLCAEAASFDLPSSLLTACMSEAKNCIDLSISRREISSDKSCNPDDFAILRALLLKLEKRIAEVPIESKDLGFTKPGPYIYELLAELNITQSTANMLVRTIEKACILLEEDANAGKNNGSHNTTGTVFRLESLGEILNLVFRDSSNAHAQYYRVHVQQVESSTTDVFRGKTSRTLSWWCFNPGIAMEEFARLGVASIILTSGTLSPLDSFAEELKLEFPLRLENPHVISENQIWAGVAPVGPSGYSFNSSYRNRGSIEYKLELGNAIVNFARIVPDGLLVFFPSYYLMEQCISCWKDMGQQKSTNTIWERISKHKLPVVEPRQSSLFPSAIEDYMAKLKDTSASGAVFFAVCRGKVSEGLDFADHAGRAVVVTGMPFATLTDPKVRLKREYLDMQVQSQRTATKGLYSKGLTGEEWYSQLASRAVNQAVGRVIRHQHDYGAIIFCDERFSQPNRLSQISLWMQPHVKCHSRFGDVVYTLTRFFRDAGARAPSKLEVTQNDHENESAPLSFKLVDKFHSEKLILSEKTSADETCSSKAASSNKLINLCSTSTQLSGTIPANRLSLASNKLIRDSTSECSGDPTIARKKYLISEKSMRDLDEETGKTIAPCLVKKQKLLITGPDRDKPDMKCTNQFNNVIKSETVPFCEKKRVILLDDEIVAQKETSEHIKHDKTDVVTATRGDVETKGSSYLAQVRQNLSDAEYSEFVGFLKALKSKAMKLGHVLQSIVRLFSVPGRSSLLHGFKDYVPAKYHSLYEQYLRNAST